MPSSLLLFNCSGLPGRVAQSVGHLTRKSEVLCSIPGLATYFHFSFRWFKRDSFVSYWRKYVHEVLVNRLGGLSLLRKSVVKLTDRPDMTLDFNRGGKITTHQLFRSDFLYNLSQDTPMWYRKILIDPWLATLNVISVWNAFHVQQTGPYDFTINLYFKFWLCF